MAYLWVVLCGISADICLRWVLVGVVANKGREAGPFCIWSNRTPFPFHHFQPRILSSNAAVFDKLFDN